MEEYNKIIESLGVRFIKARHVDITQPVRVVNFYDVENTLVLLNKGHVSFGEHNEAVNENDLLFIPAGKANIITYGKQESAIIANNEEFINHREKYFRKHQEHIQQNGKDESYDNFFYLTFEAKVFDSVSFFTSLDLPAFTIKDNTRLAGMMRTLVAEAEQNLPGKNRVIHMQTDQIVVEIIRYILANNLFLEQLATNSTYFKDPRLIDIFTYIKQNLGGDLSNKVLANVANVSEDYVGQYFKMLTGINPQDYIEYQRMEMAVNLLRTSKKSIRNIGNEVGYKDTAYFCRRFKMMFGIPAGKLRRRETLMNV
jgi:AraC-like DNA-binding protein